MKAAVLEKVNQLRVKDVPKPALDQDEILVQIAYCGICGTDIKLYQGKYSANVPVILGHEYAGTVVEIGKAVSKVAVGDRVVPDPNESCGACYWCRSGKPCFCTNLAAYGVLRDGGFAEYAKLRERGAYRIPAGLDYDGACFTEPVSCAVHCIDRAAVQPAETVVIIGGGPMGQILVQLVSSSASPAKVVLVSRSTWKLDMAKGFGAAEVINATSEDVGERVRALTDDRGADVVIEAVGTPQTIEQAIGLAKKSGRVVIFGFVPEGQTARFVPFEVLSKELTIMGSWVNPYTFERALQALAGGQVAVAPLVSEVVTLDGIDKGFQYMSEQPQGFMKALVRVGGGGV